ncbi:response regulator [Candidatus Saccharibacteria bacterium]|nr:response regulator [Candidatus Saccharibacteria bacterium]
MIKIAIIEDDQTIAQMYRMKFESEGFAVDMAANGRSGVDMVTAAMPDAILLDLQMPEMNGAEALKRIRELPNGHDIPVIILTNLGQEEAPRNLDKLGVDSYIVKADLTPRQVVHQVKKILGLDETGETTDQQQPSP